MEALGVPSGLAAEIGQSWWYLAIQPTLKTETMRDIPASIEALEAMGQAAQYDGARRADWARSGRPVP